jgi:hypothetical protein
MEHPERTMRPSKMPLMMRMISICGGKSPCHPLISTLAEDLVWHRGLLAAFVSFSASLTCSSRDACVWSEGRRSINDGTATVSATRDVPAGSGPLQLLTWVDVVENDEKEDSADALVAVATVYEKPCTKQ